MSLRRTPVAVPPLPPGRPLLVVTGFMGTGKTTAGRLAAERLGLPFFDLDAVVEARAGVPVGEIFGLRGEAGFRRLEAQVLAEAARLSGAVVATGGGAVLAPEWERLARSASVSVLSARPEVLAERLRAGSGRPLLAGDPEGRMRALLDGRAASYGRAGEALDTSDLTPERVADELARRYRRRVSNDDPSVDVPAAGAVGAPAGASAFVIAPGALHRLGELLTEALPETRSVAVAFDPAVASVAATVAEALRTAGVDVRVSVPLPSGEAAKTAAAVGSLWSALAAAGLDRTGAVVAVGGGATLDAAGFAAATFARGVPLVNVPTTVLAMVDAAVGGKVGIDHAGIKNSVGAFHPARLVVADPNALATLPERARRAGLAEAVKAFVVASPIALDALPALDLDRDLLWVVEQAVRIKAAFVAVDPFDTGARHALNLGHTFAHALESATGFDMPHGEAVAVGLVAAARLGAALGVTPPELEHRVARTLAAIALPTVPPSGLDRDALLRAMAGDKKRRGGGPVFVVPTGDGVELVDGLDAPSAVEALLQPVAAGSRT